MGRLKRIFKTAIADNRALYKRGLKSLLSAQEDFEVRVEASSLTELLSELSQSPVEAVLLSVELLETASERDILVLRQLQDTLPVLFLAPADEERYLALATAVGARACMLKNSEPAALLAGIRKLVTREPEIPSASAALADLQALAGSNDRWSHTAVLTPREKEILRFLAEGLTVRQTAGELSLSVKTVEAHKLNLMRKLDIHDRATLIEYATRHGIVHIANAA